MPVPFRKTVRQSDDMKSLKSDLLVSDQIYMARPFWDPDSGSVCPCEQVKPDRFLKPCGSDMSPLTYSFKALSKYFESYQILSGLWKTS